MVDHDRRSMLLASYENAAVIVSGIDPADLGRPTPCPKYDVAALIDHLVEAAHRAAALGRGHAPPPGDKSPHVELSDGPDQPRQAAEDAAQAWDHDSKLSSKFTMPWGEEFTGADLVDMYLAELAAHAWDLAQATGQIDKLDASVAVAGLGGARAMIKPENRDMVEPGSPFGQEVPPPPRAPTTGAASPPSWDATREHCWSSRGDKVTVPHIAWCPDLGCLSGSVRSGAAARAGVTASSDRGSS
jgi:uncharacterized protein (TIGR03086 family)